MADKRAFAKFDVGYLDNPKTLDVLDASPIAVLMHAASILYCAQHLTDGLTTESAMRRKVGGTPEDADMLVRAGLWHREGHDCESCPEVPAGKVLVHDYLEHNRSSEDVKKSSEKAKKMAEARWNAESNAQSMHAALPEAEHQAVPEAMQREKERDKNISSEVADATSRPDVVRILDLLDSRIEANGAKKPNRTKRNTDAARLLLDLDGYTEEQVAWMIRWATSHEFWRKNILSMSKLREKFDRLKLDAGVGAAKTAPGFNGEVDVDAILGKDYWQPPAAPEGMTLAEEIEWKREQRRAHNEDRLREARAKVGGPDAA